MSAAGQPREQRRGRAIAMSPEERDAFLAEERTCRVATVGGDGSPHVAPLWFVWDGAALWLNSIVKSQRWAGPWRSRRAGTASGSTSWPPGSPSPTWATASPGR